MKIVKILAVAVPGWICAGTVLADVVLIVHPTAAVPTRQQIADVYLGRNVAWKPLDQLEATAIHAEFYRKATGRDLAQVKAIWSRLLFTGRGRPPAELPDSAAVKKAVASDPHAMGYVDSSSVDTSVKAVPLD